MLWTLAEFQVIHPVGAKRSLQKSRAVVEKMHERAGSYYNVGGGDDCPPHDAWDTTSVPLTPCCRLKGIGCRIVRVGQGLEKFFTILIQNYFAIFEYTARKDTDPFPDLSEFFK